MYKGDQGVICPHQNIEKSQARQHSQHAYLQEPSLSRRIPHCRERGPQL